MQLIRTGALALSLAAVLGSSSSGRVSALPLGPAAGGAALAAQYDQTSPMIQVRHRGGNVAAGIIGGMILGGIIASQRPYYYGYPTPYYRAYRPYPYDPAITYCLQRFRSYDPYSITYLG